MPESIIRYNPAFQSDIELRQSFVVREEELALILETIQQQSESNSHHVLLVGPRGVGKTTLVLRAVSEVRNSEDLNTKWFPIVFAEESYEAGSPGELWLLGLYHLANLTG